jgi:hypothetical protein
MKTLPLVYGWRSRILAKRTGTRTFLSSQRFGKKPRSGLAVTRIHLLLTETGEEKFREERDFGVIAGVQKPGQFLLRVLAGKRQDSFGQVHLPGASRPAIAFAELGDDDDVVKNRIGRHSALLQRHDEIIEVLTDTASSTAIVPVFIVRTSKCNCKRIAIAKLQ